VSFLALAVGRGSRSRGGCSFYGADLRARGGRGGILEGSGIRVVGEMGKV
jgi:hypothetical protein